MTNDILFENIPDGGYILDYPTEYLSENVKYASAEFNKLYVRKVRLPDGKNNKIFLLSNSFDKSLNMIADRNFLVPPTYKRVFYPIVNMGKFLNKRYRFNVTSEKSERNNKIKEVTKLIPFAYRKLPLTPENNFIITSDIVEAINPIIEKSTIKRVYSQFYSEFIDILNSLYEKDTSNIIHRMKNDPNWNNRIMIIDAASFAFKNGAPLKDNKNNPLFLLYLSFLRSKDLSKNNIDMDMLIYSKNMFMKFNPKNLTSDKFNSFRRILFKIMNANLDEYSDQLTDEEKLEIEENNTDKTIKSIVANTTEPFTKDISTGTKITLNTTIENKIREEALKKLKLDTEIRTAQADVQKQIDGREEPSEDLTIFRSTLPQFQSVTSINPVEKKLSKEQQSFLQKMSYDSLVSTTGIESDEEDDVEEFESEEEDIAQDVMAMMSDEDVAKTVLDEIQDNTMPLNTKNSPVNSKRDQKLREEQKKVVVGTQTIEEILSRDKTNVPIETTDKSKVMHTCNNNMKTIKFANFDKTYLDELYMQDIVACFDSLKDLDSPFYVTKIDIKDTSDAMDYKETWTVSLRDELNKKYTIKVDIPKFKDNRFMVLRGNRFTIAKQNFYNPLVKDTADTVILTTNFNKITITRKATKSLSEVERLFSLIKKSADTNIFTTGDSSKANIKYISTLEYDEISRRLFQFKSDNCEIFFSRNYIENNLTDKFPKDLKGNEFFIGTENGNPIIINEDTGLDRANRTIIDIIIMHLPDHLQALYESIKGPKQNLYVMCKMAGCNIPIICALLVWNGISNTLDQMKIKWNFDNTIKRIPKETDPNMMYIRFADGILSYEKQLFATLILNGLAQFHPEHYDFEDFNTGAATEPFVYSAFGTYNGINELRHFNQFLVDPVTKQVCRDYMLPDTPTGLLIHASKLLCDNSFVSKASDTSYRTRSIEIIPAILYSALAAQYKAYVKSGKRVPMTLNPRVVISTLQQEKTVETFSVLNPVTEVNRTHTISTKGYKGSNSEHAYRDEAKRSYDKSSIGKLAMSTSADKNVGITKQLVVEPTISNARGYREPVENVDDLKDVNIFSPVEMLTPGTARGDDPIRSAINVSSSCKTI